jgi:hypothetical protein
MKKFLLVVSIVMAAVCVNGQSFKNGDLVINAGLGVGYTYGLWGYDVNSWPTLHVSAEKGIMDFENMGVIAIGGFLSYKHFSVNGYSEELSWSDTYVGGRGIFHYTDLGVDKLDVYGGIGLGLRFYTQPTWVYTSTYNYRWDKETHTSAFLGLFLGGRYYLTDKVGVFGEVGYDAAWLKAGVSFKL